MYIELQTFLGIFENKREPYKTLLKITSKHKLLIEFKGSIFIIYGYLKNVCCRDSAFYFFEKFLESSTSKSTIFELLNSFHVVGELLFGIFSQSNTLSVFLINNSEYLFWLIENSTLGKNKDKKEYLKEMKEIIKNTYQLEKIKYLLRMYKKREYLRIASREILGACDFSQIMRELAYLASAFLEMAIDIAYMQLKNRYIDADKNLCIIALGKLGTEELNFSSDIDIMFVHRDNDKFEYYNKFASLVVSIINDNTESGFIFRVDTTLRPHGAYSPLSLSIDDYENYYSTLGQPWEKIALLKARFIAGNKSIADAILSNTINPFVYKKSIDLNYIDNIRLLVFKVKKYTNRPKSSIIDSNKTNIKKGIGGIREIEFIVHYFQLLYGAKESKLRHASTLYALKVIKEMKYISKNDVDFLINAYIFLRKLEHKLQLQDEVQTQQLPLSEKDLSTLSCKMGLNINDFIRIYNNITDNVHKIFTSIFIIDAHFPVFGFIEDIEGFLKEKNVKQPNNLAIIVNELSKNWISQNINRHLIQSVFDYITNYAGGKLLYNIIDGLRCINPMYISALYSNKMLFKLFVTVLSFNYGSFIEKNQFLMEEFFSINNKIIFGTVNEQEKLRIEFACILKVLAFGFDMKYCAIFTKFADNVIENAIKDIGLDDFAVLGLGKIGIYELFVGSDIDLVFISKNPQNVNISLVYKLIKTIKRYYDIDLRLRPFGEAGAIVVGINSLKKYFSEHLRSWERLSYQKARLIYSTFGNSDIDEIIESVINVDLNKNEIKEMKLKIEREKAHALDIKNSAGGLVSIEFIAQYLSFKHRLKKMSKSSYSLLSDLEKAGILNRNDARFLRRAYLFYVTVLSTLRVIKYKSNTFNDFNNIILVGNIVGEDKIVDKINIYMHKCKKIFDEIFI